MAARRLISQLIAVAALALVALLPVACGGDDPGFEEVTINGEAFRLEIARDPEARARGFMERHEIPADGGMLFIFPDSEVRAFWMGHCYTDMDILFLDARGRVTAMHRMIAEEPQREDESDAAYDARMPRYSSRYPAQFAIELAPGTVERLGVAFEDRIDLDLDHLKTLAQ